MVRGSQQLPRLARPVRFKCTAESHLPPVVLTLAAGCKNYLKVAADGRVRVEQTRSALLSALARHVDKAARGPYELGDKSMFVHPPAQDASKPSTSACMLLSGGAARDDSSSSDSYGRLSLGMSQRIAVGNKEGKQPCGPQHCSIRMHALMCALRWGWSKERDACHAAGEGMCNNSHKHCMNPLHLSYRQRGENISMKADANRAVSNARAAKAAHARRGIGGGGAAAPGSSEHCCALCAAISSAPPPCAVL